MNPDDNEVTWKFTAGDRVSMLGVEGIIYTRFNEGQLRYQVEWNKLGVFFTIISKSFLEEHATKVRVPFAPGTEIRRTDVLHRDDNQRMVIRDDGSRVYYIPVPSGIIRDNWSVPILYCEPENVEAV